jgi:hypothetical protein
VGDQALAWVNHCMLLGGGYRVLPLPPPECAAKAGGAGGGGDGGHARGDHVLYGANLPPARPPAAAAVAATAPWHAAPAGQVDGGAGLRQALLERGGAAEDKGKDEAEAEGEVVPVVFLHGVGMGLQPYLRLLMALAATGGAGRGGAGGESRRAGPLAWNLLRRHSRAQSAGQPRRSRPAPPCSAPAPNRLRSCPALLPQARPCWPSS